MKAYGNGMPETCASNLLRIVRGEISYDRVRGLDSSLIDQPNATDEALSDAEWVLETFEPRINVEDTEISYDSALSGNFSTVIKISKKEGDNTWMN